MLCPCAILPGSRTRKDEESTTRRGHDRRSMIAIGNRDSLPEATRMAGRAERKARNACGKRASKLLATHPAMPGLFSRAGASLRSVATPPHSVGACKG